MNQDTIWQLIRYALMTAGGFLTGRGVITAEHWELILGALGTIVPVLWGLWVKWNTTPVLDTVVKAKDVPTVSGATGAVVPAPSRMSVNTRAG